MIRARTEAVCHQAAIEALKAAAWERFERIPHANPMVGREAYRAEIDEIERKFK